MDSSSKGVVCVRPIRSACAVASPSTSWRFEVSFLPTGSKAGGQEPNLRFIGDGETSFGNPTQYICSESGFVIGF